MNPALPTINPKAAHAFESVDPGVEYYAAASWDRGDLAHVELRPIADAPRAGYRLQLVIEVPQIYDARAGGTGARVRVKDVADTLFAAGRIADRYKEVVKVTPAQWKGQLTKEQDHERTRKALTQAENALIDAIPTASQRGHVLDAVGIGLKFLWRR